MRAPLVQEWPGEGVADERALTSQLQAFTDTLVEGWRPLDVVWEVARREGYALDSRVESSTVEGATVWRVSDPDRGQHFYICLDDRVELDLVHRLGLVRDNLFVCRDSALTDETAANLALQCRLRTL